jgi:hypothetical protein
LGLDSPPTGGCIIIEVNGYHIVGPNRELYLRCSDKDYDDPAAYGYDDYLADDPAEYVTEVQSHQLRAQAGDPC